MPAGDPAGYLPNVKRARTVGRRKRGRGLALGHYKTRKGRGQKIKKLKPVKPPEAIKPVSNPVTGGTAAPPALKAPKLKPPKKQRPARVPTPIVPAKPPSAVTPTPLPKPAFPSPSRAVGTPGHPGLHLGQKKQEARGYVPRGQQKKQALPALGGLTAGIKPGKNPKRKLMGKGAR